LPKALARELETLLAAGRELASIDHIKQLE